MKTLKQFTNDLIASIPKKLSIELALKKQDSLDKLWYQERQERDFLQITPANAQEIVAEIASVYAKQDLVSNPAKALQAALKAGGLKYKEIVLGRFGAGMKDVPLKPLTREYIKQKGTTKIGYNTGNLYRDIKQAAVIVTLPGVKGK